MTRRERDWWLIWMGVATVAVFLGLMFWLTAFLCYWNGQWHWGMLKLW